MLGALYLCFLWYCAPPKYDMLGVFSTTKAAKGRISHAPKMVLGTGDQFGERYCDDQLLPRREEHRELPPLYIAQSRLA